MHSTEEPNSFFGWMAAPSWNSEGKYIKDPAGECSWLFKLQCEENKYFDFFILMEESIFINGNALTAIMLFMGINVYFLIVKEYIF